MSTEESRAVVQRWLELAGSGDIDGAFALFTDDILQRLIGPLFAELEGGISSDLEAVVADGDRVVVLSRGKAAKRDGTAYNNTYAQVFTVRGGRIAGVREYMDTALVDRVFGAAAQG